MMSMFGVPAIHGKGKSGLTDLGSVLGILKDLENRLKTLVGIPDDDQIIPRHDLGQILQILARHSEITFAALANHRLQ